MRPFGRDYSAIPSATLSKREPVSHGGAERTPAAYIREARTYAGDRRPDGRLFRANSARPRAYPVPTRCTSMRRARDADHVIVYVTPVAPIPSPPEYK